MTIGTTRFLVITEGFVLELGSLSHLTTPSTMTAFSALHFTKATKTCWHEARVAISPPKRVARFNVSNDITNRRLLRTAPSFTIISRGRPSNWTLTSHVNMKNGSPSPRTTESISLASCIRRAVNEHAPGHRPDAAGDPHRVASASPITATSRVGPARGVAQLRSLLQSVLQEVLDGPDLFDEDES